MRRILYVANLKIPTAKAYGIQIAKNCEAFARLGLEVELVVPYRSNAAADLFDFYGLERIFKFKILPVPNPEVSGWLEKYVVVLKEWLSAWRLAGYAKRQPIDLIFSRDPYTFFLLSFFRPDLRNAILEVHRFSPFRRKFYGRIVQKGGSIVATTGNLKKTLVNSGLPADSITIIPNGVDLKMFDAEMTREQARSAMGDAVEILGWATGQKVILYSGNLYDWKGAQTLNQAVEKYLPETKLIILQGRPFREVPLYLKAADVLVLPNSAKSQESLLYTSPLKMFEYMASRRPIVASRLPSISEVLNDGNAILVAPDDPAALAAGIKQALAGGPEIEGKVEQAYQDVKQYSLETRARRILNLKR